MPVAGSIDAEPPLLKFKPRRSIMPPALSTVPSAVAPAETISLPPLSTWVSLIAAPE
jgi:hypothetical protein